MNNIKYFDSNFYVYCRLESLCLQVTPKLSKQNYKYFLTDLDVRVRDAPHVHGGELHGLDDGDGEGLRVEVVLQLVLQLAKVAAGRLLNL